jgi:hypothetical protein
MHERLISYLKDNRDQILETWLLEAEIPALYGESADAPADVPLTLFAHAFERTLNVIQTGNSLKEETAFDISNLPDMHLDDILGVTCTCKLGAKGGRVCIALYDSGLIAFLSVLDSNWDADHEFNECDRTQYTHLINHALSTVFTYEIEHCQHKTQRSDCPFACRPAIKNT